MAVKMSMLVSTENGGSMSSETLVSTNWYTWRYNPEDDSFIIYGDVVS
jgi:hypothetical protein